MARLRQKSGFIRPGKAGGYAKYIATRERVEKLEGNGPATEGQKQMVTSLLRDYPESQELFEYQDYLAAPTFGNASAFNTMALDNNAQDALGRAGYAKYIGTRPRAERSGGHGLFGIEASVSLDDTLKELDEHQGNVWTLIYSLRREDAELLGYNHAGAWQTLLRSKQVEFAKALKISPDHLRWCAAFHDESYHPHIHMMLWSEDPKEGFLTKQGILDLRSEMTNEIFRDELHELYMKKDVSYKEVTAAARETLGELVRQMNQSLCDTAGYDADGKRIIKNVLGKTQAEVKAKLKEAVALAEVSNIVKADEYTLVDWLRYWMDTYGTVYLRESSQVNYEGFLKNQIANSKIGKTKLQKLTTHDFQLFYNQMRKSGRVQRKESEKQPKGLAPKSIRNMHFFISHALEQAVKEKMIPENPVTDCILPKKEKSEMKTLPLDKLEAFFLEAKHSGVFELYYTELSTGLRRGELLGIHWDDVDFEAGSITIQRQITRLNGKVKESPLKTKNAYRQIIVAPEVIRMLKEKKEREDGFSIYVFSSPTGGPMCPDSMLKMLHRVLNRAELEEIPFHAIRHTFATLALQNGMDVKTLSGLLGHYSAGFTLDTYGHITKAMKQDAAEKVGGFLAGAI